jgi:hypothetical protein
VSPVSLLARLAVDIDQLASATRSSS